MPARIERALPGDRAGRRRDRAAATVRCILESLALAYRRTVAAGRGLIAAAPVDVVHVVGGGARNELLCQLTADACGVPVLAGPVEASALGNVLVQARALGADLPDLAAMRALVARDPRPAALRAGGGRGPVGGGRGPPFRRPVRRLRC